MRQFLILTPLLFCWQCLAIKLVPAIPIRRAIMAPDIQFRQMNMRYCKIPKNSSTMMRTILCDLFRDYLGIPYQQEFKNNTDWNSDCTAHNWYPRARQLRAPKWSSPRETKFAVVRDPIDRFVSLYGHICVMNKHCKNLKITDFARVIYHLLRDNKKPSWMKKFIADIIVYHAQPQSWFCDLPAKSAEYSFIRYSRNREHMENQIVRVFQKAGVPEAIAKKVVAQLKKSSTTHAFNNTRNQHKLRKELTESVQAMEYFYKIYEPDFEMFNFE